MCPVTPSSKPNLENNRNEAARRSLRCRRSSSTLANLGGPGNPGFLTGAVAIRTSEEAKVSRAEYSTGHAAQRCGLLKRVTVLSSQSNVAARVLYLPSGIPLPWCCATVSRHLLRRVQTE